MLKKLLFPTDFSPSANNAFSYALQLALHLDAEIVLLHAYHFTQADARLAPVDILEALNSDRRDNAISSLQAYQKQAEAEGYRKLQVHSLVKDGFAEDMIREGCEQVQPDLVVMGCKGAGKVSERLLGSVTTAVMRDASYPVLAIPERARYHEIRTIAYATDFQEKSHIVSLQLHSLAQALGANICGVHVSSLEGSVQEIPETLASKLGDMPLHFITGDNIESGLSRFIQEKLVNILAVMPVHRSFFEELFHNSITSSLARYLDIPILAFHDAELTKTTLGQ